MTTTLNKNLQHGTTRNAWRAAALVSIGSIKSIDGCPSLCEFGYQPELQYGRALSAGKVI